MMLNINLKRFKFLHKKKQNQIIFSSIETTGEKEILNLIDNFLIDKNSFVFGFRKSRFLEGKKKNNSLNNCLIS